MSARSDGTVGISVYGRAVDRQPAMAWVKRSPKRTANWALASAHSRGGILHSLSARSSLVTIQHVAGLQPVEQAREAAASGGGDASRDRLGHDPAGLDGETGGADLLELVVGGLAGGGDADVGGGARHGRTRPERLPGT